MLNPEALQQPGNSRAGNSAPRPQKAPSQPLRRPFQPQPLAPAPVPGQIAQVQDAPANMLQRLAFFFGLATIFAKIAVLPELLVTFLHVNTYLLWIVSPPALFGALFTGAIGKTLRHKSGRLFLWFFLWMLISLPFSSWVGGSVPEFRFYFQNTFVLLFVVGGLTVVWGEVRSTFITIGAAGIFIIGAARFLALNGDDGRLQMASASSTIGNENDLASHLIFVLPFVLYLALDQRINRAIRCLLAIPIAYGVFVIFATASRGGLISLFVCFLFVLFRGSARQRMSAVIVGGVLVLAIPILLSGTNALDRLGSLFGGQHEEAKESGDARDYLLRQSIIYTFKHPVFGIGMDQFPNYEGKMSVSAGITGNWHETHNSVTQVSSELGVPAMIFFVMAIGTAMASVNRIYGRARREGYTDIANASFCYLLSMAGYLTSIIFLSNAYRYYLPVMIGLAVALTLSAQKEMSRGQGAILAPTGWMPPVAARRPLPQPFPQSFRNCHSAISRMRILYYHSTHVPPPTDVNTDRFCLLSETMEGDVLQPIWFRTPEEVEARFGPGSYPVHTVGKFRYHWFLIPDRDIRGRLAIFRFVLRKGRELYRERGYQCIVAYSHQTTGLMAGVLKLLTRNRLIIEIVNTPQNSYISESPNPGLAGYAMRLYSDICLHLSAIFADRYHFLFPRQLDYYPLLRNARNSVFHEFVPVSIIEKAKDAGAEPEELYVLQVGAPWYLKGVDVLLKAFAEVAPEFPNARLKLLGFYPGQEALLELTRDAAQVEVLRARPNPETLEIIKHAAIMATPSRTEGLPRVIMEAMAAGIPVVASDVGGISTLVHDGVNGYLIRVGDHHALAQRLRQLLSDAPLRRRMGEAGYVRAHNELNEQAYVREFTRMIEATIHPKQDAQ